MTDHPCDPRHPRTVVSVEHTPWDAPFDAAWRIHRSMRAARPTVKRIAQALADSTGSRVKAVREDATGLTRIYVPTH